MSYTREELADVGAKPVAKWLIEAALNRSDVTYGHAAARLEAEHGFTKIFSTHMGTPAWRVMHDIHSVQSDAPLLNVLLVRQNDRMPGEGAGSFMAEHFGKPELAEVGIRTKKPHLWRKYFKMAANEVYAFTDWPNVFRKAYGHAYSPDHTELSVLNPAAGKENDGIPRGRVGEGPNHKALRLWVNANPAYVLNKDQLIRAETEVDLKSGDRVDVVYFSPTETIAIEVKSRDSNEADFTRGLFQCVKYRAVLQAMNPIDKANITAILITESDLPGHLKYLARQLEIKHVQVPKDR